MTINHNVAHYVIGGVALVLAGTAVLKPAPGLVHEAAIHQVQKPSRMDWANLGQDKTVALGEALKGVKPGKVTLFCSAPSCHDFQADLDDAFQIAEWRSDFETRFVDSEASAGLFVGPPGGDAENLVAALAKTTGIEATVVPIDGIEGVGIIIGKTNR
jgi:hypothetical protein